MFGITNDFNNFWKSKKMSSQINSVLFFQKVFDVYINGDLNWILMFVLDMHKTKQSELQNTGSAVRIKCKIKYMVYIQLNLRLFQCCISTTLPLKLTLANEFFNHHNVRRLVFLHCSCCASSEKCVGKLPFFFILVFYI